MAKFNLENNPLFSPQEEKPVLSEKDVKAIKEAQPKTGAGRPKNSDADDFQRMTFIVRKEHLEKLRDYAYTERIDLKIALDQALESFLKKKKDLLRDPRNEVNK